MVDKFVKYDLWMTLSNNFFDVISGFDFLASMANRDVFADMTPSFYKKYLIAFLVPLLTLMKNGLSILNSNNLILQLSHFIVILVSINPYFQYKKQ